MSAFVQIQVTFAKKDEAERLVLQLVENRLIACGQILGPMTSDYRWEGAICSETEYLLLAKTRRTLFETVSAFIRERHSYDCPQIVSVALDGIETEYRDWLEKNLIEQVK